MFGTIKSFPFAGGGEIADELRKEIQSLRIRVDQLENEIEMKNNEIKQLASHKVSDATQVLFVRLLQT